MNELSIVLICPEHGRIDSPDDEHPTLRIHMGGRLGARMGLLGVDTPPIRDELTWMVTRILHRHVGEEHG